MTIGAGWVNGSWVDAAWVEGAWQPESQAIAIGLVTETDTAFPITPVLSLTVAVGQAAETNSSLAMAPAFGAISPALNQATINKRF